MRHAGKLIAMLLAVAALGAAPAYAERGGHGGPRAVGHAKHAHAHARAHRGHERAHQAHDRARHRAHDRRHFAQNQHRDRDNNPPGPRAVRDPGVNHRQAYQRGRIGQGVRSGELTKAETRELAAGQRAIRKEERAYKSDGRFTREERKGLHRDLNTASRDIREEKHDDETR